MNKPTFRAWDKIKKKMYQVSSIHIEDEYMDLFDKSIYEGEFTRKNGDVILMQSTRLKDRNGVVYSQDDLVKWERKIYRLILGTHKFELVGFYEPYQDEPTDFFSEGAYLIAEIVGNIHENPELLNEVEVDG